MVLFFGRLQKLRFQNAGMVLVMSLWILALLTTFAVSISLGIRQRILLISRLERRSAVHDVAKAGVQTARLVLIRILKEGDALDAYAKASMHNNPSVFQNISFAGGICDVSYADDGKTGRPEEMRTMFGMEDEGAKLNINTASIKELTRLFVLAAGLNSGAANELAKSIVDWRETGDTELLGFYSDDYYASLNFPYQQKKAPFEILEEVLLLKGMNPVIFERVRDFITVYGDGKVNLNMASSVVLTALGLNPTMAAAIINMRNGDDGQPATADDHFFRDKRVSSYLNMLFEGDIDDSTKGILLAIDDKMTIKSRIYRAKAKAVLDNGKETRFIDCVFEGRDAKILAWREY